MELSAGRAGNPLPIAANAYTGLAEIALARGDLANARHMRVLVWTWETNGQMWRIG